MTTRNFHFNRLLALGIMFLAIAGAARLPLGHHGLLSPNLTDGIIGLFYGLAFGCIFLGFRRNMRGSGTAR